MTHEEIFARKDGPALSVAHHVHATGDSPGVGQSWTVDVVAVSGEPSDAIMDVGVYPFIFETKVTPELLRAAARLMEWVLQRKAAAPYLPVWYLIEERMILYIRIPPPDLVITEDDLRASIDRSSKVEREIRGYPRDLWTLYYLAKNWMHHIPSRESQHYYRGQTYGFRLTLASIDTIYASEDSDTMTMLGIIHIFLAGVSAKSYFKLSPKLILETGNEWEHAMPAAGGFHRLDPFEIGTEEAELLATSMNDTVARTLSRMTAGALEVLRPYDHVIPSNDTIDFYRGLTHGLQLSVRAIRMFNQFPLVEDAPRLPRNFESGTAQMSCLAAQRWVALRLRRSN